jgi:metallo-beta-lactamase class B
MKYTSIVACFAFALALAFAVVSATAEDPSWTRPFPVFRITGHLYYVGSEELASYLVVTPDGLILINSNLAASVPEIRKNIELLGFKFSDIKILLISQGHFDHCAGSAEILRETGAKYYVMKQDVDVVESGGRTDFYYAHDKSTWFEPAKVDHALEDGEQVKLGGTMLTAHLTAGHNKGTTTWTLDQVENGRTLHVVIVGGPNVNKGYKLVGNAEYPQIADDFAHGFDVLQKLPCDIFLGAHGSYFGLQDKFDRYHKGGGEAFIDPHGYHAYIADRRRAFEKELKRQRAHADY